MSIQPQPNQPTVPSTPDPTGREQLVTLFQAILALLGVLGVAVPPIFANLAVEQQVAGIVLIVVPLVLGWYQRLVTKPAEVHAAAVASAAATMAAKMPRAVRLR